MGGTGEIVRREAGTPRTRSVKDGDTWVIKATGVRPDGTIASSTNVLVPAGKDAYVWRSTDRVLDDEVAAPVEVKVIRKRRADPLQRLLG